MAETLIDQIKEIQRKDSSGKMAWWKYADEQGKGMRDPAKHDDTFLQYFINQYKVGAFAGGVTEERKLGELFKEGQRFSPAFKAAWANYVNVSGFGNNDPTRQEKEALVFFLDQLGKAGSRGLHWGGPPAKRARHEGTGDPEKDRLVETVKTFQRSSEANKELWYAFCETQPKQLRDPARYSNDMLQSFIQDYMN